MNFLLLGGDAVIYAVHQLLFAAALQENAVVRRFIHADFLRQVFADLAARLLECGFGVGRFVCLDVRRRLLWQWLKVDLILLQLEFAFKIQQVQRLGPLNLKLALPPLLAQLLGHRIPHIFYLLIL